MFRISYLALISSMLLACGGQSINQDTESSSSSENGVNQSSSNSSSSSGNELSAVENGRILYFSDLGGGSCASCHGDNGEGIFGRAGPLVECDSCDSPSALLAEIDSSMPAGKPELCKGDCANDIAAFIFEEFNDQQFQLSCDEGIQKASPMRRLYKDEIVNAVQDVFIVGAEEIRTKLPNEQGVIGGFPTVGNYQSTQRDWIEDLLEAATNAAEAIVSDGFFPNCSSALSPPAEMTPHFGECTTTGQCQNMYPGATDCDNAGGGICYCGTDLCSYDSVESTPSTACFQNALEKVGKRLFRESLSSDEIMRFTNIREQVNLATGVDGSGDKAVVVALLTSPKFLFSLPADDKSSQRPLSDKELAERLAFTLWVSVPDEELLDLAASGNLSAKLDNQIDRMINDERFDRFFDVFVEAWVGLDAYNLRPEDLGNDQAYLDQFIQDIKTESLFFIRHIIKNNLSINEIYTANYTFINSRLAEHYGYNTNALTDQFNLFQYPNDDIRRGLMTHASVLAKAFDGSKTSVVKRGVLPLEAFTCNAPEPPTNNPEVEVAINEQATSNISEKDKILSRAERIACAGCHAVIDPIGWVFTDFDSTGRRATHDPDGDPLNPSGTLFGQNFSGASEMIDVLTAEDQFASCFANKFLIYAIGRKVEYKANLEDQCAINQAIDSITQNDQVGSRDLIKALLLSDISRISGTVQEH